MAPSAIKVDLQTIATTFSGYVQKLQNSGYNIASTTLPTPTQAQLTVMGNAATVFSSTKFRQAEQHLAS